jgi:hypothetical protein
LSEPAIEIARWYEKIRRSFFLPPELEHLRGKRDLSMSEVDKIVFLKQQGMLIEVTNG